MTEVFPAEDSETRGPTISELDEAFYRLASKNSASLQPPLDTGLWPLGDLKDDEIESLVTAMQNVQRQDIENSQSE
ncbi:hypothetical protein KW794_01100 [Candidatus Saccharibacteria bacterium]|nr:hypothetical protein [Candidatus Saccharibacteria bacterium]